MQYTIKGSSRPFRWTAETGLVDLTKANPQLENFYPVALSADGAIMAGRVRIPDQDVRTQAAIFANGTLTYLGSQQNKESSDVAAMTPNGEIMVGTIDINDTGLRMSSDGQILVGSVSRARGGNIAFVRRLDQFVKTL